MTLPNRIYFTGVPGSRWSGIAQVMETIPGFNTSDRTPDREYSHGAFSGHKGAYFGKKMELHAILDNGYIDQAWLDTGGCKVVKSHDWAYNIRQVHEHAKKNGDWVMMVYRPDLSSFAWWHEAGGFKIKYPCYDWYENSTKMLAEIQIQNEAMLSYANEVDAVWRTFTPGWQQEQFGAAGTGTVPSKDILVTMLK